MKAYKGFNKDMTCRGFQYEEGKSYETDEAKLCKSGFHACLMPLDCFYYYSLNNSVFHEVELDDISDERGYDTKVCGKKIKIGARLSIAGMVNAQADSVFEKSNRADDGSSVVTSDYLSSAATSGDGSSAATSGVLSSAATSGWRSSAATSGDGSSAATSGVRSSAATSGYGSSASTSGVWSFAVTSGDRSSATTSGNCSSAATFGKASIAVANGVDARGMGAVGSYIVLTEYDDCGNMTAKMERVDGERIKADTWYILKNGEFKEWEKSDWG